MVDRQCRMLPLKWESAASSDCSKSYLKCAFSTATSGRSSNIPESLKESGQTFDINMAFSRVGFQTRLLGTV